jgi:hypothetical protein
MGIFSPVAQESNIQFQAVKQRRNIKGKKRSNVPRKSIRACPLGGR